MTRFELNNNVGANLFTATIEEGVCEQFYASMALQQAIQAGVNLERLHLENAALFGIDFFNVNLINSEIVMLSFLAFNSSIILINSLEFK